LERLLHSPLYAWSNGFTGEFLAEICLRAERRLGELIRAQKEKLRFDGANA
jgi:hypothetical protein